MFVAQAPSTPPLPPLSPATSSNPSWSSSRRRSTRPLVAGWSWPRNSRRRRAHEEFGFASCATWLAWRCSMTRRAARSSSGSRRSLAELPRIRAEFSSGRLSYSKVRALAGRPEPEMEERADRARPRIDRLPARATRARLPHGHRRRRRHSGRAPAPDDVVGRRRDADRPRLLAGRRGARCFSRHSRSPATSSSPPTSPTPPPRPMSPSDFSGAPPRRTGPTACSRSRRRSSPVGCRQPREATAIRS